jgi:hypothetical protein
MRKTMNLIAKGLMIFVLFIPFLFNTSYSYAQSWSAHWIWTSDQGPNNTWLSFRKKVTLSAQPSKTPTRIAAENKYWLYVNDVLVVVRSHLTELTYKQVTIKLKKQQLAPLF